MNPLCNNAETHKKIKFTVAKEFGGTDHTLVACECCKGYFLFDNDEYDISKCPPCPKDTRILNLCPYSVTLNFDANSYVQFKSHGSIGVKASTTSIEERIWVHGHVFRLKKADPDAYEIDWSKCRMDLHDVDAIIVPMNVIYLIAKLIKSDKNVKAGVKVLGMEGPECRSVIEDDDNVNTYKLVDYSL